MTVHENPTLFAQVACSLIAVELRQYGPMSFTRLHKLAFPKFTDRELKFYLDVMIEAKLIQLTDGKYISLN